MKLRYTVFGESHGPAIGVVIENLPAGIPVDEALILREMSRRQARSDGLSTTRKESDLPQIISGVYNGKTTGTPLCAMIANENVRSKDYDSIRSSARPSHADYTGHVRYGGHNDPHGGGHFSGRLTAPLVFAGAIAKLALKEQGIFVGSHLLNIGTAKDLPFTDELLNEASFSAIAEKTLAVIDDRAIDAMRAEVLHAKNDLTSVGGSVECAIVGLPAGLGSPDEPVEGILSQAMFRVPAVKGIAFGLGFDFAESYGHEVNDPMRVVDGKVVTTSNYNGGILGGITNGMPILFKVAVKPTPTIAREQESVDLSSMTDCTVTVGGRHDPCILPRAAVVIEAAAALSALQLLQEYRPTLAF